MTDILCKWLNNEVKLSRKIDATNFNREFSTGYLIGEVLSKYQLQDDFDQFSQSRNADSKLNNFTRVEPLLHLLEIPFDTNVARDIMTEQHGTATKLMYQLFIALKKKEKNNLTGTAIETMRPAAPVKLEGVESKMYKERLKHLVPRQSDLNLNALQSQFHQKQLEMEATAFKERFEEQERYQRQLQDKREELIRKYNENKAQKSEMLAKIKAATVQIPKPPPNRTAKAIANRRAARKQQEAEQTRHDIAMFEDKMKRTLPPSKSMSDAEDEDAKKEVASLPDSLELIKPASNSQYLNKIRKRLEEDASARAEREKRRRKVLNDQLNAHHAQEEARREEMLVNRLMRQSQQERRIAVQLLQARHEKDVIRQNRLMREKQYAERRQREFHEALNREAEMARLAKLEYIEQTQKDEELHNQIMAERAEQRYRKHYEMSAEVLSDIVDFSTKVGEYRELTNRLLPAKLMRDWTSLFIEGKPLYEPSPIEEEPESEEPTPEQILEEERQQLLDEGDFTEYRNMMGDWVPLEGAENAGPPADNPIVGHVVQRLMNIVHPPSPPPPAPEFPAFPIKACAMGRVFAGKSSCIRQLAENHRLQVLSVEELVAEAVEAYKNGEIEEVEEVEEEVQNAASAEPGSEQQTPAGEVTSDQTPQPPVDGQEIARTPGTEAKESASKQSSAKPSEIQPDNRQQEEAAAAAASAADAGDADEKKDEGTEKTDPEKPVEEENTASELGSAQRVKSCSTLPSKASAASRRSTLSKASAKPKLTPRAKLGAKASKLLNKGRPVEDPLSVEILVEAIRRIPEGTGWILDGFPSTYAQAKLLEKALSGYDAASRESSKLNLKETKQGKRKSVLAPDPRPVPPPPEPSSGINVAILFDIQDELCLKRSAGRTYAVQAEEQFHQEFKPPPEGSATGVGKQEKVLPIEDTAYDQEQIQHRLTTFQDSWPRLEKWFTKFGSLKKVDASQPQETVYLEVENILEETLKKLQGEDEPPVEILEVKPEEEEKPAEPEKPPEPEPEPLPPKEETKDRSRPSSRKGSRAGSAKRSGSRGSADRKAAKGAKSPSKSNSKTGDKSAKGSRGSSPKSPKRSKSGSKKAKTPEPEPEPEPEVPPGTPPPQPGSDEWEYVDQAIDEELAQVLAPHWEAVENSYIYNSKCVFRNVRGERENIIRYLFQIRKDYLAYLRRPDHKQEFVSQWQKDFNEVADDIRDDDETRSELHQRLDDLRERLWSICDERKDQAEKQREGVINDGWLDDRLGLLSNHYITLMQTEVDRFQDTVRMLKDYYKGMEGKIPDELQAEYVRLPLIELPVAERPPSAAGTEATAEGEGEGGQAPADEVKSIPSKSVTPSGKKKKEEEVLGDDGDELKKRIPLIPRRPVSPDPTLGGKGKVDKAKTGKGGKDEDFPPPPQDPDERLLFDAHVNGFAAIEKILHQVQKLLAEQVAKEAEEEAEKEREKERELEKQKQAVATKGKGKGKGGKKSRSPSPKKGKGKESPPEPTPPPPVEEVSEEEKEKKRQKERGREEYMTAIKLEGNAARTRLDLVKMIGISILQELKNSADGAYKEMHDWLGARFLKEMESIDQMSEVLRNAIESGSKLREEVILEQEDFLVNADVKVLKTPSPEPPPEPVESATLESFTVDQILSMYKQFMLTSPTGLLSVKGFQDTFLDLTAMSHGTEQLPDSWLNVSQDRLEALSQHLAVTGGYVDWRAFLLAAAHPWPVPTQTQLLETLARLQEMDQEGFGCVTREQYDRTELWFCGDSKPATPAEDEQELPHYNRLANLKASFFDIFADHSTEPVQLDYVGMLMYFSADPMPYEGLVRALSVASGTHMPRLPKQTSDPTAAAESARKSSRPPSQASITAIAVELEGEKQALIQEEEPVTTVPTDIPDTAVDAKVPLEALVKVLHHGQSMRGDSHRFAIISDAEDIYSAERLGAVYQELGNDDMEPLLFSVLIEHPLIQDTFSTCNTFRSPDLKAALSQPVTENVETQSMKTTE